MHKGLTREPEEQGAGRAVESQADEDRSPTDAVRQSLDGSAREQGWDDRKRREQLGGVRLRRCAQRVDPITATRARILAMRARTSELWHMGPSGNGVS